jgi:hypothetical protein
MLIAAQLINNESTPFMRLRSKAWNGVVVGLLCSQFCFFTATVITAAATATGAAITVTAGCNEFLQEAAALQLG